MVQTIGRSQVAHNTNAHCLLRFRLANLRGSGCDLTRRRSEAVRYLSGVIIMDLAGLTWDEFIGGEDNPRLDNRDEYKDMLRYSENDITLEISGKFDGRSFMWRGIENGYSLSARYEWTLEAA